MSRSERNTGKLVPLPIDNKELFAEQVVGGCMATWASSFWDQLTDDPGMFGMAMIDNILYKVEFSVEGGEEIDEFCNIHKNEDGTFLFDTYHYNGSAHWTELLEGKLK